MDEGRGIVAFLESLADDADKEALFEKEPVAVMMEFGLSEPDQLLILEGSISDIRNKVREVVKDPNVVAIIIKVCPDPPPHH